MDPSREPRASAEPTAPRDILTDDAIVAYLRSRAPGLPPARFDGRVVTTRARDAMRRLRRRRLRTAIVAMAATATVYLALALAGPLLPVVGPVNVPGGSAIRGAVARVVPGLPPAADERSTDVDRLQATVLPVVERLGLSYYLRESDCHILQYSRGQYADPPQCGDMTPFDAQVRADFDEVTGAVERSGVTVERIYLDPDGLHVRLPDSSWQYNYAYVYRPSVDTAPAPRFPEDQWTHIGGAWWFFRSHDD